MTALTPLLVPDAPHDADPAHQRADVRSNMFVTAVLYCDGSSAPVRIRNMSRGGALIECAVIPPEQSPVTLSRGSLGVSAHVIWRRDNRAGIQFDAAIEVAEWLPRGNKPNGQQRVDEMIHACRTAGADNRDSVPAAPAASQAEAIRQLLDFRDALNAVAEELAGDMAIAMGHPTALQKLDVTAQMLEKLASKLAGSS